MLKCTYGFEIVVKRSSWWWFMPTETSSTVWYGIKTC